MVKKTQQEVAAVEEPAEKQVILVPGMDVIEDASLIAELNGVEGAGRSDSAEDRGTPLLYVAQKGSPQLDKKQEKYVPGMEVGDIFNSLTGEFYKGETEGVIILPCFFRMNWNVWTPRDQGGGFHGSEPRDTPLLRDAKPFVDDNGNTRRDIFVLPDGNQLRQTAHYYAVIEDTWTPIVIPMSSTNLGASRKIQSLIDLQKAQVAGRIITKPAFWSRFRLKTVYTDDGDNQWYKYTASVEGPNENPQLREFCKQFALSCQRNDVKMAAPIEDAPRESSDDIPF